MSKMEFPQSRILRSTLLLKVLGVFKKRKKRKYNSDFKLRAIKLCLETDKPDAQIAKCLGIDQQTIHNHLGKMPVLANPLNADLSQEFTVTQVAQKHGWTDPMIWSPALEEKEDLMKFK